MASSLIDGNSILAIDVGAANTRAVFFDVVEGEYRFVASGVAPSTAEAPYKDVSEGVRNAIQNLQSVLGRSLLDGSRNLITPSQPNGSGVDALVATLSAGPTIKTVLVGLLKDVSLESARRLAESTYMRIVETLNISDRRKPDQQIDAVLRARPDLIVIAGGTDGGASRSIQKLLEPIGLASFTMPEEKRPAVLYAGNEKIEAEIKTLIGSLATSLHFSPNVRPSLDTEDLEPAQRELARMTINIRKRQIRGVDLLDMWSGGHLLPTAYATGRMVRFLSKVYSSQKGILSVDLGASAAIIAAGFSDKSSLNVYPQFGLGENLTGLLNYTKLEDILRWSSLDVSPGVLRDYMYQKALYPSTIAATKEDLDMSQAIARQALFLAMQSARRDFPRNVAGIKPNLTPLFEPILAGGGILSDASRPGQSLLLLLDGIQPVGVTTVIIDQNNLLPLLGVTASQNNILPVQVLESGAFLSVGTVVAPVTSAAYGTPILRAILTYENGTEARMDLKYGGLETLPLANGQTGKLTVQCLRGTDVGFGPGRGGTIPVSGGALGVVFDGRGRPLDLPADSVRRRDLIKKWNWTLGGE
ncbi:MAG TPA: glutamate mutase L [Anaerolineales bacterium]|nr:glutamate mutase L [Anaerolineales bacterium]HMV95987.1 glutamate mutase L [Anaerolineales bacterium]HMX20779.1 glutamate mutase L [Anaerolineales bacterium]HMX74970.1 glutamate mutase L [Anaerolineales bacterium]HMZ43826.1 glutamate mutase L [Anaerolineales bacterium]